MQIVTKRGQRGQGKEGWVAVLLSDKVDCKSVKVTRDKEGHCTMIKCSMQKENINYTHIKPQNPKIYEAHIDIFERSSRQFYNKET